MPRYYALHNPHPGVQSPIALAKVDRRYVTIPRPTYASSVGLDEHYHSMGQEVEWASPPVVACILYWATRQPSSHEDFPCNELDWNWRTGITHEGHTVAVDATGGTLRVICLDRDTPEDEAPSILAIPLPPPYHAWAGLARSHLIKLMGERYRVEPGTVWTTWWATACHRFFQQLEWFTDVDCGIDEDVANRLAEGSDDHSLIPGLATVPLFDDAFDVPPTAPLAPVAPAAPAEPVDAPNVPALLAPYAGDASPYHPTVPGAEAPTDREVVGTIPPLHFHPDMELRCSANGPQRPTGGSRTFLMRDRSGKLVHVYRSTSGWGGDTIYIGPVFGFHKETLEDFFHDHQYSTIQDVNAESMLYPVEIVPGPVQMDMEFTRDEILVTSNRKHRFFKLLLKSANAGNVSVVEFRVGQGASSEATPASFKAIADRSCRLFHNEIDSNRVNVYRLVESRRIGSNTYTHVYIDISTMAVYFITLTEGPNSSALETKSRTNHPIASVCVTGLFDYVKPMDPSVYLAGYRGLPYHCPTCGADHEAPFITRRLHSHTSVDEQGATRRVDTCPRCPVVRGTCDHEFVRNAHSTPANICHNICPTCLEHTYRTCTGCQCLVPSAAVQRVAGRRGDFCEQCVRSMVRCGECGLRGPASVIPNGICQECTRNTIKSYSFKPTPKWTKVRDDTTKRFYGVELEVENSGAGQEELLEFAGIVARKMGKGLLYCKRDGSINNGFEIVSHPFTEKWFEAEGRAMWDEILVYLQRNGFSSYEPGTCGMHIHVSRNSFQPAELFRVQQFVHLNAGLIHKLSRREASALNRWASPAANADRREAWLLAYGKLEHKPTRYSAVNVTPPTIEYRFPRGTTHREGFPANVELAAAISAFAGVRGMVRCTGWQFVDWVSDNGDRFPNLVKYLFKQVKVKEVVDPGRDKPPAKRERKKKAPEARAVPPNAGVMENANQTAAMRMARDMAVLEEQQLQLRLRERTSPVDIRTTTYTTI